MGIATVTFDADIKENGRMREYASASKQMLEKQDLKMYKAMTMIITLV